MSAKSERKQQAKALRQREGDGSRYRRRVTGGKMVDLIYAEAVRWHVRHSDRKPGPVTDALGNFRARIVLPRRRRGRVWD